MKTAILNLLIIIVVSSQFAVTANANNSRSRSNLFECVGRVLSMVSPRYPEYSTTETTIYFCNTYSDAQIERIVEFSKLINFDSVVKELTVNTLAVNCASMLYIHNTPTEVSCALNFVAAESRPPFHIARFREALLECRHNPALRERK